MTRVAILKTKEDEGGAFFAGLYGHNDVGRCGKKFALRFIAKLLNHSLSRIALHSDAEFLC
jgi:hypothetical protein